MNQTTAPPQQYHAELQQLRADVISMAMRIERAMGITPGGPGSAIRTRDQRRKPATGAQP